MLLLFYFGKFWKDLVLIISTFGQSHLDLGFPLGGGLIAVPVSSFIIDLVQIVDCFLVMISIIHVFLELFSFIHISLAH